MLGMRKRYVLTLTEGERAARRQRLAERLMPLLDRSNHIMLRNLKALRTMRERQAPTVSIGSAGQVNVAQAQVNANAEPGGAPERRGDDGGPGA
jgi:hypothetical protein